MRLINRHGLKTILYRNRPFLIAIVFFCIADCFPGNTFAGPTGQDLIAPQWKLSGVSSDLIELPILYSVPHIRDGDLQEIIPGVVTVQQDGAGTASHYFLRGDNHIYGSGVYTTIDDMPLTMDQHAVANGYTDVNMIIPELLSTVSFKKGPYDSDIPGGSASGHIDYEYPEALEKSAVKMSLGENLYFHTFAATSDKQNNGDLLYAVDLDSYAGPWKTAPEDKRKIVAYIKQSWRFGSDRYNLSLIGFRNNWNTLTPIPSRAVDTGTFSDLSSVTRTDEGKRRLMGISARWQRHTDDTFNKAVFYFMNSEFNLYTNNTYYLFDATNGDQQEQVDRRNTLGIEYSHSKNAILTGMPDVNSYGVQLQRDLIGEDALYHTVDPDRLGVIRNDRNDVLKIGVFWKNELRIKQGWLARAGLRFNQYHFDLNSNLSANSGTKKDSMFTGDIGLQYKISQAVHAYFNTGQSYNTNQARDVIDTINPVTGLAVKQKDIFIPVTTAELGLLLNTDKFVTSLAVWNKRADAELILSPINNTLVSNRASQRSGIEWLVHYAPNREISTYLSTTYANIKFSSKDSVNPSLGNHIPGIPQVTGTLGITYMPKSGYYYKFEGKYIGSRPLDENDTLEARAYSIFNFRAGFHWSDLDLHLDLLNLLNNSSPETEYLYTSRLAGEPTGGVQDTHYRIVLPRTYRLSIVHQFK